MRILTVWLALAGALLVPSAFAGDAATWTAADYAASRDALLAIPADSPLPHLTDPNLALWVDTGALKAVMATAHGEELLALFDAIAAVTKVYSLRSAQGYGEEHVAISVGALVVSVAMPDRLMADLHLSPKALRTEDVRRRGLVLMRLSMTNLARSLLLEAEATPPLVPPSLVLRGLAPIADQVSPWLLTEERAEFRERVARLAARGGDREAATRLTTSLRASAPTSRWVSAFEDEHRAAAAEDAAVLQKVLEGAQLPVSAGQEAGGTRWTTPDGTLSAVFPSPPNVGVQTEKHPDGSQVQGTTIGVRNIEGTRSITCILGSTPLEDSEASVLAGLFEELAITNPTRVETPAGLALEGGTVRGPNRIFLRASISGSRLCMVMAEGHDGPDAQTWQRAFIDSARITAP